MGVKVTSTVPNVADFAEHVKIDMVARKATDWENRVNAILRAYPKNIGSLAGEIHVEITDDGFVGSSDSENMKFIEFGMDEHSLPGSIVAGMETIEQIAPMRRALATL